MSELVDDTLFPEGLLMLEPREMYDQCIVGIGRRFHDTFVLYDEQCIIKVIEEDIRAGSDDEEAYDSAREHFEFNTIGGWYGETTPGFVTKLEDLER